MKSNKFFAGLMLATTLYGVASPAFAEAHVPIGYPFLRGYGSPQHIADVMQASFKSDPEGTKPMDPSCSPKNRNVCSTADQLHRMLLKADPAGAPENLKDVPAYLRTLVLRSLPQGVMMWSACLVRDKDSPPNVDIFFTKWDCELRVAKPGEMGYFNPVTNKQVMQGNCSNPLGLPDEEHECVIKAVYLRPRDTLHRFWLGSVPFPSGNCTPAFKAPGATTWSPVPHKVCPKCDGSAPLKDASQLYGWNSSARIWNEETLTVTAETEGYYLFREPVEVTKISTSEAVDAHCVVYADGTMTVPTFIKDKSFWKRYAYLTYGSPTIPGWDGGLPKPWRAYPSLKDEPTTATELGNEIKPF